MYNLALFDKIDPGGNFMQRNNPTEVIFILKPGIYEQVISKTLGQELDKDKDILKILSSPIDPEEASKILSKYIEEVITQGLENIKDNGGELQGQVGLINRIVKTIVEETGLDDLGLFTVDERAEQLMALLYKENSIYAVNEKADIVRPVTSIAQSSLFTGAKHEPSMITELKKEISSSDRIDFLVSFIKWSGIRMMIEELRAFTQRGGKLRIITTSYMGATDAKAIEELNLLLNTKIKISYNTKSTRLHAKSYVFYRN